MKAIEKESKGVGILPHLLFLFFCAAAVVWMEIATRLPLWAAVLIVSPQTALVTWSLWAEKKGLKEPERKPRRFELASGLICGVGTLLAGIRAASYFFLIYLYGLARVRSEQLRLLAMPKGRPWIVSNGDRIYEGYFLHYLIGIGIWMGTFPVVYWLVYQLLPVRKDSSGFSD